MRSPTAAQPDDSPAPATVHRAQTTPANVESIAIRRQKTIEQAADEGHDADIPSDIGYIEDEKSKRRHRRSAPSRAAKTPTRSNVSGSETDDLDLENGAPVGSWPENGGDSSDDDANAVWWDGDDDPENPFNWPGWKKALNIGVVSFLTFITPLASSIFAPGVPQLMREFGSSNTELASFVVSVWVLGFAAGPLVLAPLSEIYGRTILYHICNLGFVVFCVACALAPSLESLIVFRFFGGIFGSCPLTNGGGSIADMVRQEHRATAMSLFTVGPLLGPVIGPVAGGFIAQSLGWRWNFWLLAILGGVAVILMPLFLRESYAPVLLKRKVQKLRAETGNDMLRSKLDNGLTPLDFFNRGMVRPFKMLVFSPIVLIFAIYLAIIYGYLYLMFTSITPIFEQYYGFSTSTVGLAFLGLGVGSALGLAYFTLTADKHIQKQAEKNDRGMKPEDRLMLLPFSACIIPIGLFMYGWTAQAHVQWIAPLIGMGIVGVGNIFAFMCIQLRVSRLLSIPGARAGPASLRRPPNTFPRPRRYLVDAFDMYAASSLAGNTVLRSIFGAVLPLAGLRMYDSLGVGWGNSVLGFISLVMVPVPFVIIKHGERLRKKFEIKNL